jgi:CRP-like cAMP-binding protein
MRAQDPKIARLRDIEMFSLCPKRELALVARMADELTVPAGRQLMRQGAYGADCVVVVDGEARITRDGEDIGRVGPGELVGEIALLDSGGRTATVVAETPMRVLVFHAKGLSAVLHASSTVRRRVLRTLASRLRITNAVAIDAGR